MKIEILSYTTTKNNMYKLYLFLYYFCYLKIIFDYICIYYMYVKMKNL